MAQDTAATVRMNSSALTNWLFSSLKAPAPQCYPVTPIAGTYPSPLPPMHLRCHLGGLNSSMRIQDLTIENKQLYTCYFVFGIHHYGKVDVGANAIAAAR